MNKNLASFLTLGYFLDYKSPRRLINLDGINKKSYIKMSADELTEIGIGLWRSAIDANFEPDQSHLVPISGGLDSRAILAALLEHTDAARIQTFTFGSPGTLDFDIGCEIAKQLGTRHTAFDLTQYNYTQEEAENIARRIDHQCALFHHWPVHIADGRFSGAIVWSGFLGDPLAGSHLPDVPAKDLTTAIKRFLMKNQFIKSCSLLSEHCDFVTQLDLPRIEPTQLTFEEQLDFLNRQVKYIAPHVLMKGYLWRVPFLHQPWVDFILSVPNEYRRGQLLYKRILSQAFPVLFAHRTKSTGGFPLNTPKYKLLGLQTIRRIQHAFGARSLGINYLDFNKAIRVKPDLREIISNNLMDLNNRSLMKMIDSMGLLKRHLEGRGNYADALIALASVEIHLKSGLSIDKLTCDE